MTQWRLRIWSPTGTGPVTITKEQSVLTAAGLTLQVTPEGDLREGRLNNRGKPRVDGLEITPLSVVQFQVYVPEANYWASFAYGQVRQGGNTRNVDGENVILRSPVLRLGAVTLSPGFHTDQQPAHMTVRAALTDVLESGQLGSPPLFDAFNDHIPDLGFNLGAVKDAAQQTPLALLERVKQEGLRFGVDVRYGVDPDRHFYCKAAKSTTMTLGSTDTGRVKWKEPVAETPCTAVLWFVARRPDNTWITHLSVSPDAATYGQWTKAVSVESGVDAWTPVYDVTYAWYRLSGTTWVPQATEYVLNPLYLTDADVTTIRPSSAATVTGSTVALQVNTTVPFQRLTFAGELRPLQGSVSTYIATPVARGGPVNGYADLGSLVGPNVLTPFTLYMNSTGVTSAHVYNGNFQNSPTEVSFRIAEYRPDRVNTELLDALAAYHYSVPQPEPADLTLATTRPPNYASLTGRVSVGTYDRAVEAWEYRLSAARGFELAALTGQADDPAQTAQAALIRARDQGSVISALTAQR